MHVQKRGNAGSDAVRRRLGKGAKLANLVGRLARRQGGAAVMEYALLLALMVGSVVVVCEYMTASAGGTFAQVGGQLPSRARAQRIAADDAANPSEQQDPATQGDAERGAHGFVAGGRPLLVWLNPCLVAVLWVLFYRRRLAAAAEEATEATECPSDPSVSEQLPQGLFAKRQQLLSAMTEQMSRILEPRMQVRHLMSDKLVVVEPRTKMDEVRRLMAESKVRHLLVCETDKRLAGVISDRDLKSRAGKTAGDVLTRDLIITSPDTPVNTAVSLLINNCISCLPVVEGGKLCGILTTTDVLLAFQCSARMMETVACELRSEAMATRNRPSAAEEPELVGA